MSNALRSLIFCLGLWFAPGVGATAQWIEHASSPGPSSPQAGQSRFDDLFRQATGAYHIPYPFTDLVDALNARIEDRSVAAVRQVFVPHGRSLQRESPAPHYFQQSRVVIAVEGEPRPGGTDAGHVLEYRLFIAHQPSTESLEVISYNDEAGRFEFQVVENYAADKTPGVRQANRTMCLSCHQNAAPIFPRKPWKETSFNIEIANRLIQARPDRHASLIGLFTRDAGVIDVLVERANYLSAAQHIWRYGCESRVCRAAMLRSILQYRLSSEASFNWHDHRYRQDYYAGLERSWKRRWPRGLALANSRIPDRDPFAETRSGFVQDPLFAREAHASWYAVDTVLARGIIFRLAGFLTLADVQSLDRHLIRQHEGNPDNSRRFRADCEIVDQREHRSTLVCGAVNDPAALRARLEVDDIHRFGTIRPISLQIPGDTNIWQPDIVRHTRFGSHVEMLPGIIRSGLSARLSNGDRIVTMSLNRLDNRNFTLEMEVSRESRLIDAAIEKLVRVNAEGFSAAPFRRRVIVAELMHHLDMPPLRWPDSGTPPPAAAAPASPKLDGDLALLNPYCAHCHGRDSKTPPGFLYGSDAIRRIRQCAPRILSRLEGWQRYPDIPRSPMPPPASLALSGVNQQNWPRSDHYHSLKDAVRELIGENDSTTHYDDLPPCLSGQ